MLSNEPEAASFEGAVQADPVRLMSTASYLEVAIVIEARFGEPGGRELDLWLHRARVDPSGPMRTTPRLRGRPTAGSARGRHPAALNYGDCFAYALAKVSGEPLLFKGNDFGHTDIDAVDIGGFPTIR